MRRLTIIVLTVAALYSGYWFVGASAVEDGANVAIAKMRADGWTLQHSSLNTAGFPNRFDTTVTDISLATPDGAVGWSAAFLQVFALSYRPNEIIAVLPDAQSLRLPDQTLEITSTAMRASAAVKASTALTLRNITATSGPLTLTSDAGWTLGLGSILTAIRDAGTDASEYDTFLELTQITPPFDAAANTDGLLPTEISALRFDARLTTNKPIDRFTAEGATLDITAATLRDLTLNWGDVRIGLTGEVTFNDRAEPIGSVELTVTNWAILITAAANAGLIDAQSMQSYAMMARNAAGGADDLTVPITLTDGQATMGFIPLGYITLRP